MGNPKLNQELEKARNRPVTKAERAEQRRSFAYGNTKIEHEALTRKMAEEAGDEGRVTAMTATGFFERVRQELLKIYEGLDAEDDVKRLKKECADWKRLAEEREDAHTQGYREGRAVANIRLAELKEELKAWKVKAEALNRPACEDPEHD